jgi:hypothetical protein
VWHQIEVTDIGGVQSRLAVIFLALLFPGVIALNTGMGPAFQLRAVFYRFAALLRPARVHVRRAAGDGRSLLSEQRASVSHVPGLDVPALHGHSRDSVHRDFHDSVHVHSLLDGVFCAAPVPRCVSSS